MACRASLRTVLFTDLLRPFPRNRTLSLPRISYQSSKSSFTSGYDISRVRAFRRAVCLKCSYHEGPSSSQDDHEQGPPQEAVLKAISEVSKAEGRVGQTTNVIIGGTVTDDSTNEWLALDQKMTGARSSRKYALNAFTGTLGLVLEDNVNSYPTVRDFTAIGTGGDDFVQAMIVAVESVLQHPIPEGRVKHKLSSRGKYISVNIGPVQVVSSEQVQAVYNAMKSDDRMKYFL